MTMFEPRSAAGLKYSSCLSTQPQIKEPAGPWTQFELLELFYPTNTPKQVANFDPLLSNFSLVFLIPLSSSLSRLKLCLRIADAESTAAAVETAGCSNLIHCKYLVKNRLKDLLNHQLHPSLCNKLQKPVRWLDDVHTLVVSNILT